MRKAMCVIVGIVVIVSAGCRQADMADRVKALEEKVRELERDAFEGDRAKAPAPSDALGDQPEDAVLIKKLDKVLWQTSYLRARGRTEDLVLRRLDRIDGL